MLQSKSVNSLRNPTKKFDDIMSKFVQYCEERDESTDDLIDQIDPENLRHIQKQDFLLRIKNLGIQFDENDFEEVMISFGTQNSETIDMNQLFDEINRKNFAINDKKYKTTYF